MLGCGLGPRGAAAQDPQVRAILAPRCADSIQTLATAKVAAPYEELLYAAIRGDQGHFTREDSVEETWRILEPLLDPGTAPEPYAPGSWGPAAAEKLTAGYGGWHQPWLLP